MNFKANAEFTMYNLAFQKSCHADNAHGNVLGNVAGQGSLALLYIPIDSKPLFFLKNFNLWASFHDDSTGVIELVMLFPSNIAQNVGQCIIIFSLVQYQTHSLKNLMCIKAHLAHIYNG